MSLPHYRDDRDGTFALEQLGDDALRLIQHHPALPDRETVAAAVILFATAGHRDDGAEYRRPYRVCSPGTSRGEVERLLLDELTALRVTS